MPTEQVIASYSQSGIFTRKPSYLWRTIGFGFRANSILLYTSHLCKIIESHGISRQLFADDTVLYRNFGTDLSACAAAVGHVEECCCHVEECCRKVKSWMVANKLKLNDDKTEAIICGSDVSLRKVSITSIKVGDSDITLSDTVRDLGLFIDSRLTMVPHINAVVKACSHHLRALGQLRPQLNKRTANTVSVSLIQSRLDYCNSCLWGLPQNQLQRLQRVQNAAARVVSRVKRWDHISPVLKDLHWLPVNKRIDHKICSMTYGCIKGTAPSYLQELITKYEPSRELRSSSLALLKIPSVNGHKKKYLGARSFESAAPALWNTLPPKLKTCETKASFKENIKTFLFTS